MANTELQSKQDLTTVFGPCFSYSPHYGLFCQVNSKAPKIEQVFLHATCNNHSFCCFVCGLIHYEADVTDYRKEKEESKEAMAVEVVTDGKNDKTEKND